MKKILLLLAFVLLVFAHADEEEDSHSVWEKLKIPDPVEVLYLTSIVAGVAIIVSLILSTRASEKQKKILFIVIAVPIIIATIYLATTTIYLNITSETGGPVHWHADYEIWACGEQYELVDPEGIENRVGSPVFHEHNDNRIHVEGVVHDLNDVNLGRFFYFVGGKFADNELILPTNDGIKTWKNDDFCDGKTAKWQMFVNGKRNHEMDEYVISPYPNVPPGDCIILDFSSEEKEVTDRECASYEVAEEKGEVHDGS